MSFSFAFFFSLSFFVWDARFYSLYDILTHRPLLCGRLRNSAALEVLLDF